MPEDYVEIHTWFDLPSKAHLADFRHRAYRHHTLGIAEAERVFGVTLTLSTCAKCGSEHPLNTLGLFAPNECGDFKPKQIPVRWVGEQHVQEDLGYIPSLADWLTRIEPEPWMNRSRRLSKELEREEVKTE